MDRARSRLTGAEIKEDEWHHGAYGGNELIATYPSYRIRVLFVGDKVITTQVEIGISADEK